MLKDAELCKGCKRSLDPAAIPPIYRSEAHLLVGGAEETQRAELVERIASSQAEVALLDIERARLRDRLAESKKASARTGVLVLLSVLLIPILVGVPMFFFGLWGLHQHDKAQRTVEKELRTLEQSLVKAHADVARVRSRLQLL